MPHLRVFVYNHVDAFRLSLRIRQHRHPPHGASTGSGGGGASSGADEWRNQRSEWGFGDDVCFCGVSFTLAKYPSIACPSRPRTRDAFIAWRGKNLQTNAKTISVVVSHTPNDDDDVDDEVVAHPPPPPKSTTMTRRRRCCFIRRRRLVLTVASFSNSLVKFYTLFFFPRGCVDRRRFVNSFVDSTHLQPFVHCLQAIEAVFLSFFQKQLVFCHKRVQRRSQRPHLVDRSINNFSNFPRASTSSFSGRRTSSLKPSTPTPSSWSSTQPSNCTGTFSRNFTSTRTRSSSNGSTASQSPSDAASTMERLSNTSSTPSEAPFPSKKTRSSGNGSSASRLYSEVASTKERPPNVSSTHSKTLFKAPTT